MVVADVHDTPIRVVDVILAAAWRYFLETPFLTEASGVLGFANARFKFSCRVTFVCLQYQTTASILENKIRTLLTDDPLLVWSARVIVENQISLLVSVVVGLASIQTPVA